MIIEKGSRFDRLAKIETKKQVATLGHVGDLLDYATAQTVDKSTIK